MYFHIDESGNTGNNLFDQNQPRLSYGLLSSKTNVDLLGEPIHRQILRLLGESEIHANDLGVDRLSRIARPLFQLQEKMGFGFDYYFIDKPAYALVMLFDAVFDAGLNPAVLWDSYWTPFRFLLIAELAELVDEDVLKESWRLCASKRISRESESVVALLNTLRERAISSVDDPRIREIFVDAFEYGIANPLELDFGTGDQKMISPNAVGFQFVVSAMATRLRKKGLKRASSITVDEQTEFNRAQIGTHYNLKRISDGLKKANGADRKRYINHPLFTHLEPAQIIHKNLPEAQISIRTGRDSIGLQIVDVYLWIANRMQIGAPLSPELAALGGSFLQKASIDGISLSGMIERWRRFEAQLPDVDSISEEQRSEATSRIAAHRTKVQGLKASD